MKRHLITLTRSAALGVSAVAAYSIVHPFGIPYAEALSSWLDRSPASASAADFGRPRSNLTVEITPTGLTEEESEAMSSLIMERPEVMARMKRNRYRVLNATFGDDGKDRASRFEHPFILQVYDYTQDRLYEVEGSLSRSDQTEVRELALTEGVMPFPTPDEYDEAVKTLEHDEFFGASERQGHFETYEAMPGVLSASDLASLPEDQRGTGRERIVTVGIRPTPLQADSKIEHEIVGVSLSRHRVIRFQKKAPPTCVANELACGPRNAGQANTKRGVGGQAEIVIKDGQTEVWRFTVVRPAASAGSNGSGIDIRKVLFKGKKVLSQIHVPILNVKYDYNRCGPYRDWQYSENPFMAEGDDLAPGIRKTTEPPTTIFDTHSDYGNFRGIAVYTEGNTTILKSELAAGWYRYLSEFRFNTDGTIDPRWGFAAVQDSCTCNPHMHHAYFRMDFDIEGGEGTGNILQVFNGTEWKTVSREEREYRDAEHQRWRVMNPQTGRGFEVIPGAEDGTAEDDAYGKGDIWALRYHRGQIEDSNVYTGTSNNLNAFLTGESIENEDLVLWYAAHFYHLSSDRHSSGQIVGPTLRPVSW